MNKGFEEAKSLVAWSGNALMFWGSIPDPANGTQGFHRGLSR